MNSFVMRRLALVSLPNSASALTLARAPLSPPPLLSPNPRLNPQHERDLALCFFVISRRGWPSATHVVVSHATDARDVAYDEYAGVRSHARAIDVVAVTVVVLDDVDARRRGARETHRVRRQRIRRFGVAFDENERRSRAHRDARGTRTMGCAIQCDCNFARCDDDG